MSSSVIDGPLKSDDPAVWAESRAGTSTGSFLLYRPDFLATELDRLTLRGPYNSGFFLLKAVVPL